MNWLTIGSPKTPTLATLYLEANHDDLRGLAVLLGSTNLNIVTIDPEPRLDEVAERIQRMEAEN
jgi:hypothetical protein